MSGAVVAEGASAGQVVNIMDDLDLDHNASIDLDMSLLIAARSMAELPLDLSCCAEPAEHEDTSQHGHETHTEAKKTDPNDPRLISLEDTVITEPNATQDTTLGNTQTQPSQFGNFSITLNRTRSDRTKVKKRTIWQERLAILSETQKQLLNKRPANEDDDLVLKEGIKILGSALKFFAYRPTYLNDLLENYAIKVVELGEALEKSGSEEFADDLSKMLKSTILRWMGRKEFNEYSRVWQHTRTLIALMLRYITSVKTLLAIQHALSLVLVKISSASNGSDKSNSIYACLQLGSLLNKVNEQLRFTHKDVH